MATAAAAPVKIQDAKKAQANANAPAKKERKSGFSQRARYIGPTSKLTLHVREMDKGKFKVYAILEKPGADERLRSLVGFLSRELEVLEIGRRIQQEARGEMDKMQREYFLRQQLKAIQKELGEEDEQAAEVKDLEERIAKAGMPEEAQKEAKRELDRLRKMPRDSVHIGVGHRRVGSPEADSGLRVGGDQLPGSAPMLSGGPGKLGLGF
jgi:ATP-dependent Lon protease